MPQDKKNSYSFWDEYVSFEHLNILENVKFFREKFWILNIIAFNMNNVSTSVFFGSAKM